MPGPPGTIPDNDPHELVCGARRDKAATRPTSGVGRTRWRSGADSLTETVRDQTLESVTEKRRTLFDGGTEDPHQAQGL
jgi:hypothetical protein